MKIGFDNEKYLKIRYENRFRQREISQDTV